MKNILIVLTVMVCKLSLAQTISGIVTDKNNLGIPGVTVQIKDTNIGVVTNFDGKYTIKASSDDILVFSFIGTETQEIPVNGDTIINVTLIESAEFLDEVVIVGYGTVKKSDLTGSVSSIKAEDIIKQGAISIDQALAGKASGVQVTQGSGVPGSGASVKIRGINSMQGSEPLYVIDGIPIDNTSLSPIVAEQESSSQISPLSMINPSDVASIEILKDASATAIYGSRGANGVVLVTTKSGSLGKGRINIDSENGVMELPTKINLLNSNNYWVLYNEARINAGEPGIDPDLLLSAQNNLLPTYNWQDIVFQTGTTSNHNINFSGGNKDLKYLLSTNLFDGKGIVKQTDFNRISSRLNLDANINSKISVGSRLYFANINSNQRSTTTNFNANTGTNSLIMRALVTSPYADFDSDFDEEGVEYYTPIEALEGNLYENVISMFIGNVFAEYKISDGLSFKSNFSFQDRNTNQRFYQKNNLPQAYSRSGWAKTNDSRVNVFTNTNTLNYIKNIRKHNFNAVLGQSIETFKFSSLMTSNAGFENDLLLFYAPNTAEFNDPDLLSYSDSKLVSFFGRVNYSYENKWLLTLTGRIDGSSKFAENNKFGFFPAIALGYNISKEDFFQDIEGISNLKLRLSYGLSGNQSIQPYQSLDQLASDTQGFGDGNGGETLNPIFYNSQLANKNLKWETTTQKNIGFDLGLFNNSVEINFDYYNKDTNDLLVVGNRIPSHSGFTTMTENLGLMRTKGIDLGINAFLISNENFSWKMTGNFSKSETKIIEMGADYIESGYNNGWVSGGTQRLIVGEELGVFFGYKTAGISQFDDFQEFQGLTEQEKIDLYYSNPSATYTYIDGYSGGVPRSTSHYRPGEQLYADLNEDGILSEEDRGVIGHAQPDFYFGINNSFAIGNLDFSFFIDGVIGQDIANVMNFRLMDFSWGQKLESSVSRWTPENPSSEYPRVDAGNFGAPAFRFSDRFIEDGSYIRLQNVTLGYTLPKSISDKLKLDLLKIYISGSNLLTISDYSGYNPDVSLTGNNTQQMGHDSAGYPLARTYRLGVTLKF